MSAPSEQSARVALAVRVAVAARSGLERSASDHTVVTITDDGQAHPLGVFFDRLSSAIDRAIETADTAGVLAYAVKRHGRDYTVYGGHLPLATVRDTALRDAA